MAGLLGAWFVLSVSSVLPCALAFASGAMIFVLIEEHIPESQHADNTDYANLVVMFGFTIMMTLDVALD